MFKKECILKTHINLKKKTCTSCSYPTHVLNVGDQMTVSRYKQCAQKVLHRSYSNFRV